MGCCEGDCYTVHPCDGWNEGAQRSSPCNKLVGVKQHLIKLFEKFCHHHAEGNISKRATGPGAAARVCPCGYFHVIVFLSIEAKPRVLMKVTQKPSQSCWDVFNVSGTQLFDIPVDLVHIELIHGEEHGQSVAQEAVVGGEYQACGGSGTKVQEQCRSRRALDLSNYPM